MDYTLSTFEKDPPLKLELSKLMTLDQNQVLVPAHQSKTVHLQLKMPEQPFDGILLGGVVVRPISPSSQKGGLQNVFMHTIAIRIKQNETEVKPILKGGKVKIGQENLHNQVSMTLRNPQAKLMTQMQGTFYVTKQGSNQKLVEVQKKELSVAPNSRFEIPIQLKDSFKAGHYEYTVQLKNSDGSWNFKKNFTITQAAAEKYNKTSADTVKKSAPSWIMWLLLIVIFCLIFVIIYLVKRRKQDTNN